MQLDCSIVVMGASGSGKSTLGQSLADYLEVDFVEGDDLHPPANVAKMSGGMPLDDDDRWPWLERVANALDRDPGSRGCVASCSALKRRYRDFLRSHVDRPILFVYPEASAEVLLARLLSRGIHYMPSALLGSQIEALEPPTPDEGAMIVDGTLPIDTLVAGVLGRIEASGFSFPSYRHIAGN